MAVIGDPAARHGIVLAKNDLAKKTGVQTGDVIWQAKQKCPDIVFTPANFDRYLKYSNLAREIYLGYTDKVEPFGLDECWLDMTRYVSHYGTGKDVADSLRNRIKDDLGLTISVGASFNKVFAKLGSDMKKPDATTVITSQDYRDLIWRLPASDLLYVGPATAKKLARYGILTIGDLANANVSFLLSILGKNGVMLRNFANGNDESQVSPYTYTPPIKSIGNSITAPKDLVTDDDVKIVLLSLCESVAARLREQHCTCKTIQLTMRDNDLFSFDRQGSLSPTDSTYDIFQFAFALFKRYHTPGKPIRSLAVALRGLSPTPNFVQMSLFPEDVKAIKHKNMDSVIDKLRSKYGYTSIRRGVALLDDQLDADIKSSNIVHPVGFLGTLNY